MADNFKKKKSWDIFHSSSIMPYLCSCSLTQARFCIPVLSRPGQPCAESSVLCLPQQRIRIWMQWNSVSDMSRRCERRGRCEDVSGTKRSVHGLVGTTMSLSLELGKPSLHLSRSPYTQLYIHDQSGGHPPSLLPN